MAYPAHKTLLAELKTCVPFDRNLADQIADHCVRKKRDPYDEFICAERGVPTMVIDAWTTDEAREYLTDRMDSEAGDGSNQRDFAVDVIARYFVASDEGNYQPYRIVDRGNFVLERMEVLHLEDQVARAIKNDVTSVLDLAKVKKMMEFWRIYADRIPAPALRLQLDDPGWCLSRATIIPDAKVEFPLWWTFLSRLNDPEAFGAFVGGAYFHLNPKGRQVLYVSEEGEGGKSEVLNELLRIMGTNVSKSIAALQLQGRHFTSAFVGCGFAVVPDNMNPRIIMTGSFKEITGGDATSVEPKFQAPRDVKLNCKGMIFSNLEPDISGERSNYSRTLWLKLQGLPKDRVIDVTWGERLQAEAAGFLAWCLRCYEERCVGHYEIMLNKAAQTAKDNRVREFEEQYSHGFDRNFVADPDGRINASVVYEKLITRPPEGLGLTHEEIHRFKRWMRARHDIELSHSNGAHYYKGMRLRLPGDRHGETVNDNMLGETKDGAGFQMHGYTGPTPRKTNGDAHAHA